MKRYDGWDGILEEGEEILWQGRPNSRFRIKIGQIPAVLFGSAFSGFALFWMIMAASAGGFFWMFGLIHFSVGISIGAGPVVIDNIRRKNTWYTLTDRRAFIATDVPFVGRRLLSYPITATTLLDLRGQDPGSIFFAEEFKRTKNGSRRIAIGFEAIPDAPEVLRLMRTIQKGAT